MEVGGSLLKTRAIATAALLDRQFTKRRKEKEKEPDRHHDIILPMTKK